MTESEFIAAAHSGSNDAEDYTESNSAVFPASESFDLMQFLPMFLQLQSTQSFLTSAPTLVPQTFQDQIQFVYTGGVYYLYLYFNNQWNSVALGATGVTKLIAGTGISLSPSGGTGNVTVTNTVSARIVKTGSASRTMNASSGTQTIAHGLGKVPSIVRMSGGFGAGSAALGWSSGTYDGATANYSAVSYYAGSSSGSEGGTGYILWLTSGGSGQYASITVDATNITLSWTQTGGGALGTAYFVWEAEG